MESRGIRRAVESILTTLLFSLQHIPHAPMGIMFYPLFVFLLSFPRVQVRVDLLFFSKELMFGRVIAVVGFAIFLLAGIQFLRKHEDLVVTGFYAAVRHPQYLGIIVMTLGITIMCLQYISVPEPLIFWIIQVLGYIILARYEERHLTKEYGAKYKQYMQRVPFIFPVSCPTKISEPLFTLSLVLVIAFLCFLSFAVRFCA